MHRREQRVYRLEQRQRAATALGPEAICARAVAFYTYGGQIAPLPEVLSLADRHLVAAMLDMLRISEPSNWWSNQPLPLTRPGAPDLAP